MNIILRYLSYIILISSFFRIFPIITGLFYGEDTSAFWVGFIITLIIAGVLYVSSFLGPEKPFNTTRAILLTALSFIALSLISTLSFLPYTGFVNSLFEAVSGYTTTGLSIFTSIDALPRSLVMWRATTQWVGGFGIIVVFLYIFTRVKSSEMETDEKVSISHSLFKSQGLDKSEPSLKITTQYLGMIYVGFTVISIILLLVSGTPIFDSVVLSFSSISTGGFSSSDNFNFSPVQLVVISFIMIMGSISFVAHSKLITMKLKEFFRNIELRIMFSLILVFFVFSAFIFDDFGTILFHIISALTTTGHATVDSSMLPQYFMLILMLCMIIGGSAGSTSGGIKLNRFYILFRSIGWALKKMTIPSTAIFSFKIKDKTIDEDYVFFIHAFFFTYLFVLLLSTISFLLLGYGLMDSTFQVASALGTVGLSTMPLGSIPILGKFILMFLMLLGRLEIFPIFLLIARLIKRNG